MVVFAIRIEIVSDAVREKLLLPLTGLCLAAVTVNMTALQGKEEGQQWVHFPTEWVCVSVCVCVCERERGREGGREQSIHCLALFVLGGYGGIHVFNCVW